MWATLLSLLCLVTGDKLPIPDAAAQANAEALIHEVYGEQIKAARTAEAKSKLAREILDVAKQEPDAANKYVGLLTARRLAIEAQDGALAMEVVQVLVASFAGEMDGDADALLHRADMLWQAAEKKKGAERLAHAAASTGGVQVRSAWQPTRCPIASSARFRLPVAQSDKPQGSLGDWCPRNSALTSRLDMLNHSQTT